ncbi:MAG: ligase-associated DNA damage response endonuclease PdeM [Pseudomonadota bacterium]
MVNGAFSLAGETLEARASGALYWPAARLLAAGDLHLGRGTAAARRGEALLPPYGDRDTLDRLIAEVAALAPRRLILVGDSFDDALGAAEASATVVEAVQLLAAGRDLVWIAGNHDPRPVADLPGRSAAFQREGPITFRHIAAEAPPATAAGEVSAHYHPRATLVGRAGAMRRRCFLAGNGRVILPAFGTYTGGMDAGDPLFDRLVGPNGCALVLGRQVAALPRRRLLGGADSTRPKSAISGQ